MTLTIRTLSATILAFGALTVGCGDDDDDGPMNNMDGGAPLLDGMVASNDGAVLDTAPFIGKVVISTNIDETIPGMTVRLFNPENGMFYPGLEQTSAGDGTVSFAARPVNSGAFVLASGDYQDTWGFRPSRRGEENLVRAGTVQASSAVPTLASYTADPEASPVAGSILWTNPVTNLDEFVGCATIVEGDGVVDVRYFSMNLPTSLQTRSAAAGTQPPRTGAALAANKAMPDNENEAGKFFVGNAAKGPRTFIVKMKDVEIGRTTLFITPRKEGTPIMSGGSLMPSNLTLASIWVNGQTNPTPPDCN